MRAPKFFGLYQPCPAIPIPKEEPDEWDVKAEYEALKRMVKAQAAQRLTKLISDPRPLISDLDPYSEPVRFPLNQDHLEDAWNYTLTRGKHLTSRNIDSE
jgi:hypothetical protein